MSCTSHHSCVVQACVNVCYNMKYKYSRTKLELRWQNRQWAGPRQTNNGRRITGRIPMSNLVFFFILNCCCIRTDEIPLLCWMFILTIHFPHNTSSQFELVSLTLHQILSTGIENGGRWPRPSRSFWPFYLRILTCSSMTFNGFDVESINFNSKYWCERL